MESGFRDEDISITTPGQLDIDYVMRGVALHGEEIIQESFVKHLLRNIQQGDKAVKNEFQQFLKEQNMSGSMLVMAKK